MDNSPKNLRGDPWLHALRSSDKSLYDEFILTATKFSAMSKALLFYCSEDLELKHLELITDSECYSDIFIHPKCSSELRKKIESLGFKNDDDYVNIEINPNDSIKLKNRLSSQVFGASFSKITDQNTLDFLEKFVQIFSNLGHPLGLLHPHTQVNENLQYNLQTVFFEWTTSEVIYRTLWPEISKNQDITFYHSINYSDGTEAFYYSSKKIEIPSFNLVNHFQKYWNVDRQFISEDAYDDDWILDTQSLSYDFALKLLSEYPNFEDYLDDNAISLDSDVIDEESLNVLTAIAIIQNSSQFKLNVTDKGMKFIIKAVEFSHMCSRLNMEGIINTARIELNNSEDYGWTKLSPEKQNFIFELLIKGLQQEKETLQYYSQYFLVTIALMGNLNFDMRKKLLASENPLIKEIL